MQISVKSDIDRLARTLTSIQRQALPKAAATAINRTATSVRSEAVKAISADTGLKQKDIRPRVSVTKRAKPRELWARVDVVNKYAVNLIEFVRPNQRKPNLFNKRYKSGRYKSPGVVANAWRERKVYDGTFIGRAGSGRMLVYKRTSRSRDKITPVSGPSIPKTFARQRIQRALDRKAAQRMAVELPRQLDYFTRKALTRL